MIQISGRNGTAKVFTRLLDETARQQIEVMMDEPITEGTQVRVMPDVHAGKGSTVGTTIQLPTDRQLWKVSPNVVGVDIGCGIYSVKILERQVDWAKLDRMVKHHIPAGFKVRRRGVRQEESVALLDQLQLPLGGKAHERARQSIGTLGGGNHFIEGTTDEFGDIWLSVHSGSRNLGVQVASYYQEMADQQWSDSPDRPAIPYLEGDALGAYLNDMAYTQQFAALNRHTMLDIICREMGLTVVDSFDSIHNYIDLDQGIIRKGATAAGAGQRLIIPVNMQYGSLIASGLGAADWNYSAPHGAGRQLSRTQARKQLSLEDFRRQMAKVYTSSVSQRTLDEAPDAYKDPTNLTDNIQDTVDILHHLQTVYNFKG